MKTTILFAALAVLIFRSVNYENHHDTNSMNASLKIVKEMMHVREKQTVSLREDTSSFVAKAIETNREEIIMAQLALQRSTNNEIKIIAQKLVNDHQHLIQQFQSLKNNINNTNDSTAWDDLNNKTAPKMISYEYLSGIDFDRKWISDMIITHQKAISDFKSELNRTSDASLINLINEVLPIAQDHIGHLETLRDKIM